MAKETIVHGGIGLPGVLFVALLVLKLVGVIKWSWWWVTAPLWGPAILVVLVILFCVFMAIVTGQLTGKRKRA